MQCSALSSPRTEIVHYRVHYVALTISAFAGLLGLLALLELDTKVEPIARFATLAAMLPVNPLRILSFQVRIYCYVWSRFLAIIGHDWMKSHGWAVTRKLIERVSDICFLIFSPRLFMCFDAIYSLSTIYGMSVWTLQPISELAKFNAFLSTLEPNSSRKLGGAQAARHSNGAMNTGNRTANSRVRRRARPGISHPPRNSRTGESVPAVIQSHVRQSANHVGSLETVEDADIRGSSVETRSSEVLPNAHAQYDAEAQNSRLEFFRTWGIWPGQPPSLSHLYSSYAGLEPIPVAESEEDVADSISAPMFRSIAASGPTSELDYISFDEVPVVEPPPQYSESESSTEQVLERAQNPEDPPDYGAPPTRSTRVINGMPVLFSHLTGQTQSAVSTSGSTASAASETETTTHTCPTCNGSGVTQRENVQDSSSARRGRTNPRHRRLNRSRPRRVRRQPTQSSRRQAS